MLQKLLRVINSPGLHNLRDLARHMDVSEALIQSMIDTLIRMGYLKQVRGDCAQCDSCSSAASCGEAGSGRAWMLTEAGKRVVRNSAG
jgi:DeoR/GlpR family transcriptional regulator of sugar metabolism